MHVSHKSACIFLSALLLIALFFTIGSCFIDEEYLSVTENRLPTAFPSCSLHSLLYGESGERMDGFIGDRFPFRERLLSLKQHVDRLFTGESDGVLFTSDGYLVNRCKDTSTSTELLQRNLDALSALKEELTRRGIPTTIALAPRTIDVVHASLPKAFTDSHKARYNTANTAIIDLAPILRRLHGEGKTVMYRTDHHWTTLGVYYAYTEICPSLGITPYPLTEFQCITVKSDFIGTTQALAGCLISEIELPDTIALYRYNGDDRFTVTIHDTGETRTGLYCEEYLHTKDAYRVFLGGNFGHVSVEFDDRDSSPRPRLLLFKDSFALSLLPFLARHYDVDLIDPRYDAEAALSALLKEQQFDSALILLGRDTCATSAAIHRWCRRALA